MEKPLQRFHSTALLAAFFLALGAQSIYALDIPPAKVQTPSRFSHAVWAGYSWFAGAKAHFSPVTSPYGDRPPPLLTEEFRDFARTLAENRVDTVFVFVGSMGDMGRLPLWPLLPESPLGRLREKAGDEWIPIRRLRYELARFGPPPRILAWVGGVRKGWDRGKIDLSDPRALEAAAWLGERLSQEDASFDGVHFNIEPTLEGDPRVLELLDKVRPKLRGKMLSFAGTMVDEELSRVAGLRERFWSSEYLAEVARRVDQIAFMTYDTAAKDASLYEDFVETQTRLLARHVHRANPSCEIFIGAPTYRERTGWHDPAAETAAASARGFLRAFEGLGPEKKQIKGLAFYAAWTTQPEDWRTVARALGWQEK
ncbi:MAG: hypothetical protein AB1405_09280 [Bdellovibrionota bacterium]